MDPSALEGVIQERKTAQPRAVEAQPLPRGG
jgi:hypothetical protein